jgi:hypothetical protein
MSMTKRPVVTASSKNIDFDGTSVVEAGGVEPSRSIENRQVTDFGIPPIPLMPRFPSMFAQFCTIRRAANKLH